MGGGRQGEKNSQKHHPAVKTSAQTAAAAAAAVPAGMDEGGVNGGGGGQQQVPACGWCHCCFRLQCHAAGTPARGGGVLRREARQVSQVNVETGYEVQKTITGSGQENLRGRTRGRRVQQRWREGVNQKQKQDGCWGHSAVMGNRAKAAWTKMIGAS